MQTFDIDRPSGGSNQERTEDDDKTIDQIADEEEERIDLEENESAEKIEIFWASSNVQQRRLIRECS